jgi:hypothetical protein
MHGIPEVYLNSVSPNFFSTLGVRPRLGHGFDEDVDPFTDGKNANTIVLSDVAWQADVWQRSGHPRQGCPAQWSTSMQLLA